MKPGTQIIYIPTHAEGDEDHPDADAGFVTSMRDDDFAWCRYWSMHYPGVLRTKANSELTDITQLVERQTVPQHTVYALIEELYGLDGDLTQ